MVILEPRDEGDDGAPTINEFFGHGERVIGCFMLPLRPLGTFQWVDPVAALKICRRFGVDELEVMLTHNGGLFVRPPEDLPDLLATDPTQNPFDRIQDKLRFEERVADVFNLVLCEFALDGVVSEPAAPVYISRGTLVRDHIAVTGHGGGREAYPDRTQGPFLAALRTPYIPPTGGEVSETQLDRVSRMDRARRLVDIGPSVPTFVAGAYSAFSRGQYSQAAADAWIVVEQYLDMLWTEHVVHRPRSQRERMKDTRTYSAAVRIDFLHEGRVLSDDVMDAFHRARSQRNNLMHRGTIGLQECTEITHAMRTAIELVVEGRVEPLLPNVGVSW